MDGTFIKKLNIDTFSLNDNHKLESWVEPAFRGLMKLQIEDISPKDAECVPCKIWNVYVSANSEITRHRLALAFEAPPQFNHALCTMNLECGYRQEKAWNEGPAKMLCHPDHAYSMDNIYWALTVAKVPGICKLCYEINVEQVEASEV